MTADEHWVCTADGIARRRWTLSVESGPDEGRRAPIETTPSLIGAAPASILPLSDDTVSRYHAELDVLAAGIRIRDLRSTNGTFLEDRAGPVSGGFLWPGGRFRLGESWLRVEAHDEPITLEADGPMPLGGLVCQSPKMQDVFLRARQLAAGGANVLLIGPAGSGRAAVARQMARLSGRSDKPLFTIDAGPEAYRQLFDADGSLLLRADKGTLLLRNVDRMSSSLQISLRDALERGGPPPHTQRVDVRVLATCESDQTLDAGLLRHLTTAQLRIPSLSDRREEVIPLAEHFLNGAGWRGLRIGPRTRARLAEVDWSDEVAGLSRLVQRLPLAPDTADDALPSLPDLRTAFLSDLLHRHAGDVSAASVDLAVPTAQLFRTLHVCAVDID